CRRAQRRFKRWAQRTHHEREHGGIDPGWLRSHEERLLPEKDRDRVNTLGAEFLDLGAGVAPHAVGMQILAHLAADDRHDEGTDWRRYYFEEVARSLVEIRIDRPARIDDRPVEMVLRQLLESPGDCLLLGGKPAIEVDLVFGLKMAANEG